MIEDKSFNVIPVDKNTYIFVGEPATGKSFLVNQLGAVSLDINVFDTTVIERFKIEVKFVENHRRTFTPPIVIYLTNSKNTAEQLELYLKNKL